jgi:hypothetical protein
MDGGFVYGQVRVVRLEDLLPRQRQREGRLFSLFTDLASVQRCGCGETPTFRAFGPRCTHVAPEDSTASSPGTSLQQFQLLQPRRCTTMAPLPTAT